MEVTFYSTNETLDKISNLIETNTPGGYFRFGDGDVSLAMGITELLQQSNPQLKEYMIDAMRTKDPNILRTLPLHTKEWDTLEDGMFPGNHECPLDWCEEIYTRFQTITGESNIELYTNVALAHLAIQNPDVAIEFIKKLRTKVKYFIGNENIPEDLLHTIFNKDIVFIKTPSSNSFSKFESIYEEFVKSIKNDNDYSVVVTSMGCTGRAMQKRIWDNHKNFFLFDFGSLMDSLCGWETRAWMELTNFDKDNFINLLK